MAATSFSFINGSPNGDYKAGSLPSKVQGGGKLGEGIGRML